MSHPQPPDADYRTACLIELALLVILFGILAFRVCGGPS